MNEMKTVCAPHYSSLAWDGLAERPQRLILMCRVNDDGYCSWWWEWEELGKGRGRIRKKSKSLVVKNRKSSIRVLMCVYRGFFKIILYIYIIMYMIIVIRDFSIIGVAAVVIRGGTCNNAI